MKTQNVKLTLLSKGRKYFKCKLNGKWEAKLEINAESETLELNTELDLLVEDHSVTTKYGTDISFKLISDNKKQERVVTVSHSKYNSIFVEKCRKLAGIYDKSQNCFSFNAIYEDKVEEIDWLFNCEKVHVEITAIDSIFCGQSGIDFLGYPIAKASGRDSGANLSPGVAILSGDVRSGGSVKNWATVIEKGTVLSLEVPRNLLEKIEESDWEIKIIS